MDQIERTFFSDAVVKMQDIINDLNQDIIDQENGALSKFKDYLDQITGLGSFDPNVWEKGWRLKCYNFGKTFREKKFHAKFLNLIDGKLNEQTKKEEKETLAFLKSLIIINTPTYPLNEALDIVYKYVELFPYNPEFRVIYAKILRVMDRYRESITNFEYALDIDPKYELYESDFFNAYYEYINHEMRNDNFNNALHLIEDLNSVIKDQTYKNHLKELETRVYDYQEINKKIETAEEKFSKFVQEERKRLIEILGIFSAIIAFILTSVSFVSAANLTVKKG